MKELLIIVDTDGEVSVLAGRDAVTARLEAIDVLNGEYRAFDCAGIEYELEAEGDSSPVKVGRALNRDGFELVRELATRTLNRTRQPLPEQLDSPDDICGALAFLALSK